MSESLCNNQTVTTRVVNIFAASSNDNHSNHIVVTHTHIYTYLHIPIHIIYVLWVEEILHLLVPVGNYEAL